MGKYIALKFNWDRIAQKRVTEVFGSNVRIADDGSKYWDKIALRIDDIFMILSAECNTDQIEIYLSKNLYDGKWDAIKSFSLLINKSLGWCWIGTNSQGYCDTFTIALGEPSSVSVHPRYTFVAEASSIRCFDLTPHTL